MQVTITKTKERAKKKQTTTNVVRVYVIIQPAFSFGFNGLLFLSWLMLFLSLRLVPPHSQSTSIFSCCTNSTFASIQSFNFYLQLINIVDLLRISQLLHIRIHMAVSALVVSHKRSRKNVQLLHKPSRVSGHNALIERNLRQREKECRAVFLTVALIKCRLCACTRRKIKQQRIEMLRIFN